MATTGKRFDPAAFLARLGDGKNVRAYHAGEVIMQQGSPADSVFYLQTGKAREVVRSEQGKEATVGVLEPGLFFGTSAMDGGIVRVSSVTAMTTCIVTTITLSSMKVALKEPKFAQLFMAYLLHHNSRVEAEKVDLLFNSSEKRLAQKLLILAHVGEDGSPKPIGKEITQEMLAEMIGTTRPRVNLFLNRFKKLGLLRYTITGEIMVQPGLLRVVLMDKPYQEPET